MTTSETPEQDRLAARFERQTHSDGSTTELVSMRPWWGPEAANMTAEERAKARLSGSWVRGFNAFHALYLLEDCPAGDAQLQEQWRAGWRAAQSDALKEAANGR